jgi:hypothetical protein
VRPIIATKFLIAIAIILDTILILTTIASIAPFLGMVKRVREQAEVEDENVGVSTVVEKKAKTDVEKQILSDDTLGWGEFYNNILASNMVLCVRLYACARCKAFRTFR